jgi:hypothetical protein
VAADWTYLLADLRTGAITAEIPLTGVSMSSRLNDAGSLSATWGSISAYTAGDPYLLTTPARTAIYALRDGRPIWGGILWTRRHSSGSDQISLGAADWFSYFDHRKVLPLFTPDGTTSQVAALNTTFEQVEQNEIVRQLVAQAQAHTGGNLNIQVDTTNSGILRDRTYAGHELVDVGQALKHLAEVIDGPDLLFTVGTELDTNGRVVKLLRIGNPRLGEDASPHVYEYGANMISYAWASDGTKMATRQYATGEGIEAGALVAVAEDDTKYADGWAVLEAEATYSSVNIDTTLQEHADADLQRNRLPVVTPTITVAGDGLNARGVKVGPAIGEVQPGDDVRVVIRDSFFRTGIDTRMRVVGIEYRPDDIETATLTMNPIHDDVA